MPPSAFNLLRQIAKGKFRVMQITSKMLDVLTPKHTAFASFADLTTNTAPDYRPTASRPRSRR